LSLCKAKKSRTTEPTFEGLLKSEWRAVYRENIIRGQAGIPLRTHYGIDKGSGSGPRLLDSNNSPKNYR
jgi:hypothetical protein